jgi:hypothetical protein
MSTAASCKVGERWGATELAAWFGLPAPRSALWLPRSIRWERSDGIFASEWTGVRLAGRASCASTNFVKVCVQMGDAMMLGDGQSSGLNRNFEEFV